MLLVFECSEFITVLHLETGEMAIWDEWVGKKGRWRTNTGDHTTAGARKSPLTWEITRYQWEQLIDGNPREL